MIDDEQYMARAIQLAEKGRYSTDPNPRVGCVLVRDGEIVGEGWHERAGQPHAEINALRQAADATPGATAYVTLEPCSHFGRTPPCADALIDAQVSRVVVGMQDPNPQVAGSGIKRLRSNGIEVNVGVLEAQAQTLNPGFVRRMRSGLPWVRIKSAISLDGRTAMASGESKWITSEASRHDVQRLRARSSAIVTGIGTVLSDDPSMNVRLSAEQLGYTGEVRQPLRVVLDSKGRMPANATMLSLPGRIVVARGKEAANSPEYETVTLPMQAGMIQPLALLEWLAGEQINEVMVEAGATVAGSFIAAGLVDELIVYMAPHLMGSSGRGLCNIPGLSRMSDRIPLEISDIRPVGPDWRITAHPKNLIH